MTEQPADPASVLPPEIDEHLSPVPAGRFVQTLSVVSRGVATTRAQIPGFGAYWRERAEDALSDQDRPVIVAIGDSLSMGIGASKPELGFLPAVAERLGDERPMGIVNLARSGSRIQDVVEDQLHLLDHIPNPRKLLVLTVGNNDLVRTVRLDKTLKRMSALLEQVPDDTVVCAVPSAGSAAAGMLNRHIRKESERIGLELARVNDHFKDRLKSLASDRFHPNEAGYQAWIKALDDVLSARSSPSSETGGDPPGPGTSSPAPTTHTDDRPASSSA